MNLSAALLFFSLSALQAAEPPGPPAPVVPEAVPATAPRPLPDIPALMHQVEDHQRQAEAIQKDYIYRSASRIDETDGKGNPKKSVSRQTEYSYVDGVLIGRELSKDGKPLSPDEQKKEDERIDKEIAKAHERQQKAAAQGKETDPTGHDEITVSRILELGTFSNPRRIQVAGRDTILVDFAGDPKAKTHNAGEGAFKELAGIVAVDEQDKSIQHLEGHFVNSFKVGAGLVADVSKGTSFEFTARRVNEEAWFPSEINARGHLRYLLFFSLNGTLHVTFSDYRRFKATSTISPTFTPVEPESTAPVPDPKN